MEQVPIIARVSARYRETEEERRKERPPLPLTDYRLVLENVTSFDQYEGVRDALRNRVPDVASVELRSIVPSEFEMQVGFKGSAETLIQRLSGLSFTGFELNVKPDRERGIVATIIASESGR